MTKRNKKNFSPESEIYAEPEFYREAEFYRKAEFYKEALNYVMKNIDADCVQKRKIIKGIEEIRREFYK